MPDVTAAGVPVKLSSGEMVIITPYSQRDVMTVLKMIQQKKLATLIAAIPKDLPTELYRAAYAEAIKISQEFDINQIGKNLADMADEEILQTMLMLTLQKTYKGDAGKKALQIMDNQQDFEKVMIAANGQGKDLTKEEDIEAYVKEKIKDEGEDKKDPPESVQS